MNNVLLHILTIGCSFCACTITIQGKAGTSGTVSEVKCPICHTTVAKFKGFSYRCESDTPEGK